MKPADIIQVPDGWREVARDVAHPQGSNNPDWPFRRSSARNSRMQETPKTRRSPLERGVLVCHATTGRYAWIGLGGEIRNVPQRWARGFDRGAHS